ncbi:hypothetical protein [Mesoterricola silvestris]|uniref:Uncharacterized protein n=1 Tax=Mesoterricola silvestris TaxID=2927979 RepID=A0AA48GR96_9BACT|nr:hypothetical protein [Mesoterricola silvestris]BDU74245.1 hypothetical protein METEAL_34190 [Mesoterricola silvestris]
MAAALQGLGKQSGVTVLLHASAEGLDASTCADLRGMDFRRALDNLMLQNDLFYKALDPTSIMVFRKKPLQAGKPGPNERAMKTTVHLKDGETAVFGGLREDGKGGGAQAGTRGKDTRDRLLVVKPTVVRWGEF